MSSQFPFSVPVSVYEGSIGPIVTQAPWVESLSSLSALNASAVVLFNNLGSDSAGLYLKYGTGWSMALPYAIVCAFIINGGQINVYGGLTAPVTPEAGSTVYRNGVQSTATTLTTDPVIWATILVSSGQAYTLPVASASVLGGVKQGTGVTIAGDGTLSVTGSYTLPPATTSVLGGVIVGSGLSVTGGGTVSANVTTVNGQTGAVVLAVANISGAAPLASPTFTGTVGAVAITATGLVTAAGVTLSGATNLTIGTGTAALATAASVTVPTAAPGTNTTAAASTAFVTAAITAGGFLTTATASTTYAPLASPTLTGTPAAPTQATASTSTTQIATTAFVQAAITARAATASAAGIVKQAAAVTDLTDSTTGSVTTTLTAANPTTYTASDLNNNVASLNAQINNIISALVTAGIMV